MGSGKRMRRPYKKMCITSGQLLPSPSWPWSDHLSKWVRELHVLPFPRHLHFNMRQSTTLKEWSSKGNFLPQLCPSEEEAKPSHKTSQEHSRSALGRMGTLTYCMWIQGLRRTLWPGRHTEGIVIPCEESWTPSFTLKSKGGWRMLYWSCFLLLPQGIV